MFDVHGFLAKLARRYPLFHSEADFQRAFAGQLHEHFPNANIHLEHPVKAENWIYIDLWAEQSGSILAVELKYKTAALTFNHNGEAYNLKEHSAQDFGRYDFVRDIQRMEHVFANFPKTTALAIMLTNDPGYWKEGRGNSVDEAFRLHEGIEFTGSRAWRDNATPSTIRGREAPILLSRSYTAQWKPYSCLPDVKRGEFRYLSFQTVIDNP